jgi:ABC-type Na+ transport system ATPase subunit NatA
MNHAAQSLIEVEHLTRTFTVGRGRLRGRGRRVVHAVSDVDFTIERGEMVGYIGPNGAGKSTTIKMLTGILVPTSGHLRVAGLEPSRERTRLARRIGVVFGRDEALEKIRYAARVPVEHIGVAVTNGRVILSGIVGSPVKRWAAGEAVLRVPGVVTVLNDLVYRRPQGLRQD